ncbi:LOW QUALITY PROTEIN: regulator of microtubule dynamics protein 1-like [Haliotis rubra]|uniref:LOW QUALITY PROTEIN: regulator of microtubule dynamics protein 1-like n=1 Tax=Haliotis rubra TaxID=36100 RepID=UPI001EE62668|nr:LOW QUALITY PROTEIN: regulator of microtubule dynamics protein 1-like [Haliotis rubra]
MSFFRQHAAIISGIGTTVIFGAGATILYFRLAQVARELERLGATVASLKADFAELRERLSTSSGRRRKNPSFYSLATSSGDDDEEVYLDAYGGSDLESLKEVAAELQDNLNRTAGSLTGDDIFTRVDRLFDGENTDQEEAYRLLLKSKARHPTDVEFLWRLSKACYLVSRIEGLRGNDEKKKELLYMARDNASDALKLNDNCGNAHKWYAITLGSVGDYESTQNKIKNGFDIKKHIEKAIELSPPDPSNHHMLGRWCYSVYMLSWIERNLAATLFATPPTASVDDALKEFLEAERLNPGRWKENMLFIAKSYIEKRKYSEGTEWLEKAERIEVKSADDEEHQSEIQQLLAKYGR